jgi:uncharacterized membrane protein YhfC
MALGVPVLAALLVRRKTQAPWRSLGAGAATWLWLKADLAASASLRLAWVILLCTTAGLFEETGRYVAFRRFVPEHSFVWFLMLGLWIV